jgi:hypothetical protein
MSNRVDSRHRPNIAPSSRSSTTTTLQLQGNYPSRRTIFCDCSRRTATGSLPSHIQQTALATYPGTTSRIRRPTISPNLPLLHTLLFPTLYVPNSPAILLLIGSNSRPAPSVHISTLPTVLHPTRSPQTISKPGPCPRLIRRGRRRRAHLELAMVHYSLPVNPTRCVLRYLIPYPHHLTLHRLQFRSGKPLMCSRYRRTRPNMYRLKSVDPTQFHCISMLDRKTMRRKSSRRRNPQSHSQQQLLPAAQAHRVGCHLP